MEFQSSHTFERPLAEVAGLFLDPDAHVRRYELMGHRDIEILERNQTADALELKTVRTVEGEVNALAAKVISSTNTVTTTDRWKRRGDGGLDGTIVIEASNVPGTATITATIEADGADRCTYDVDLLVELTIPLIGDRFVKLLRPQVMEIIDAEFEAWSRFLERVDA